jgi:hypothetical protein
MYLPPVTSAAFSTVSSFMSFTVLFQGELDDLWHSPS